MLCTLTFSQSLIKFCIERQVEIPLALNRKAIYVKKTELILIVNGRHFGH